MFGHFFDAQTLIDRSPKAEGIKQGVKAAVLAAPVVAAAQALRGRSPIVGGLVGGLSVGGLVGLGAAIVQKLKNTQIESQMKYHLDNIYDEPENQLALIPNPPPFARGFEDVRNAYENPYL